MQTSCTTRSVGRGLVQQQGMLKNAKSEMQQAAAKYGMLQSTAEYVITSNLIFCNHSSTTSRYGHRLSQRR
jgi:hypothetical protein